MEETVMKPYITSNGCDLYQMNAKLQQKKNRIRKDLAELGILQKKAENKFDNYKYFSEAQYKELFTKLFSTHGIELTSSTMSVEEFRGTDKQPYGRRVLVKFVLHDIETGYTDSSMCMGEGIDKGDKALYKALTGAVKYFLANNFMVATGEEADVDNEPINKANAKANTKLKAEPKAENNGKASDRQIGMLKRICNEERINKLCKYYMVNSLEDLSVSQASEAIKIVKGE